MEERGGGEADEDGDGDDPDSGSGEVRETGASVDDAEDPYAAAVDGGAEDGGEAGDGPEDEDWSGGADAVGCQDGVGVAAFYSEDEHAGDGERDGEASVHGEHDALLLCAEDGLADEVEDGALGRDAQDSGVENAVEEGCGASGGADCGATFDELADSAAIGEWVG